MNEKTKTAAINEITFWMLVHEAKLYTSSDIHDDCFIGRTPDSCDSCPLRRHYSDYFKCLDEVEEYYDNPTAAKHTKAIKRLMVEFDRAVAS